MMTHQRPTFRERLRNGIQRVKKEINRTRLVQITIEVIVLFGTIFLAMRLTGIEPFVDAFLNAHGRLFYKTLFLGSLLYPFVAVIGNFLLAVLQGLFGLPDELTSAPSNNSLPKRENFA